MTSMQSKGQFPRQLLWLLALYFLASLTHFTHNAEYIAFYPNMPSWLGREDVYLAWLAVSAVGAASGLMWVLGFRAVAVITLAMSGALGLSGFAHYTLALCSEHSLAMNLTIWFESVAGLALAAASLRHIKSL